MHHLQVGSGTSRSYLVNVHLQHEESGMSVTRLARKVERIYRNVASEATRCLNPPGHRILDTQDESKFESVTETRSVSESSV